MGGNQGIFKFAINLQESFTSLLGVEEHIKLRIRKAVSNKVVSERFQSSQSFPKIADLFLSFKFTFESPLMYK